MEESQETYQQFIERIVKTRGRHGCGDMYYEKHHIVPKCLGGANEDDNLIDLYAKEHFIAHRLLALENPHDKKLQYAWWCMAHKVKENGQRYRCTAEEYEEAKIAFSKAFKGHEVSKKTREK